MGKRKRHRGGIVYLCTRLQTQQFVHMLLVYTFFYLLCTVFRRLSAAAAPVQSPDEVCRRNVYRFTSTLDLRFTGRTHQTYFLIVFEEGGRERGSRIRGVRCFDRGQAPSHSRSAIANAQMSLSAGWTAISDVVYNTIVFSSSRGR